MVYRQNARSAAVRSASRSRILEAARRLFAKYGYEATSMRHIADAAQTSIGNLYFYFVNKEELLETLVLETRGPVWAWAAAVTPLLPEGPARLALLIYSSILRLLDVDRDVAYLILLEGGPPGLAERSAAAHRERLRGSLLANWPGFPQEHLELILTAWGGANRVAVERWVRGELTEEPLELAEFLTRWNLCAVGIPQAEVEAAITAVEAAIRGEGIGELPPLPRGPLHTRQRPKPRSTRK